MAAKQMRGVIWIAKKGAVYWCGMIERRLLSGGR